MNLIFSDQPLPSSQTKSLFLAGPSPRSADVQDWRVQALAELEKLGFDGTVFIPIPKSRFTNCVQGAAAWSYEGQIEWEANARAMADLVVFWVARDIDTERQDLGMPGFTTNFEMGEDLASGKVLYGRPPEAPKTAYLDQQARAHGLTIHTQLRPLLDDACSRLGKGAYRTGGESRVPLRVWRTPAFQGWYANLKAAGNRLDDARLLGQVTVGKSFLFCFLLKVKVWVEAERRHKSNEFIVARPDTSAVVAAYRDPSVTPAVTKVALVREFRSTVNNPAGFVYELPAGSCAAPNTAPDENAQHELEEETGLRIQDVSRFKHVSTRQLAATFSVHRADVFAIALTKNEFEQLQTTQLTGAPRGESQSAEGESGERTYVELTSMSDVFDLPVDYATLGMLVEGLRTLELAP